MVVNVLIEYIYGANTKPHQPKQDQQRSKIRGKQARKDWRRTCVAGCLCVHRQSFHGSFPGLVQQQHEEVCLHVWPHISGCEANVSHQVWLLPVFVTWLVQPVWGVFHQCMLSTIYYSGKESDFKVLDISWNRWTEGTLDVNSEKDVEDNHVLLSNVIVDNCCTFRGSSNSGRSLFGNNWASVWIEWQLKKYGPEESTSVSLLASASCDDPWGVPETGALIVHYHPLISATVRGF